VFIITYKYSYNKSILHNTPSVDKLSYIKVIRN